MEPNIAQKMRFSIKNFFSKYGQIRSFLRIWSNLLEKSSMENFFFCAVQIFILNLKSLNNYLEYNHFKMQTPQIILILTKINFCMVTTDLKDAN